MLDAGATLPLHKLLGRQPVILLEPCEAAAAA
jgi:hypothetical protein